MPPKNKKKPKFLFDLHSLIEALTTDNNQIRNSFIDALNNGAIRIPHAASKQLKDCYEDIYKDFQDIKTGRVYQNTTTKHSAMQQSLMEKNGTNFYGYSPDATRFEMLAVCAVEKLTLVSHAKALKECRGILSKCKIDKPKTMSLGEFVAATA